MDETPAVPYDSRLDTYRHILEVQQRLNLCIASLMARGHAHDDSKLYHPEVEAFNEHTPRLNELRIGTPEYDASLKALGDALNHHYKSNSHHPQHYPDGIKGMSLLDLVEMLCDWSAATLRHKTGDILESIEVNQKRFGYDDVLKQIFINTLFTVDRLAYYRHQDKQQATAETQTK